jgi:hypothetical protein
MDGESIIRKRGQLSRTTIDTTGTSIADWQSPCSFSLSILSISAWRETKQAVGWPECFELLAARSLGVLHGAICPEPCFAH